MALIHHLAAENVMKQLNKRNNGFKQALYEPAMANAEVELIPRTFFKMATWLNKLRAQLVGIGNVATAFLIGAALTKIYYETSDTEKGKVSIQREIQEIESKHDNLKYGSHLRVISPRRQLGADRAKSDAVGEVNAIEDDKVFKYGLPKRSPEYLRFKNHVLCYDQAKKTPRWVLEHLTKEKVKGEAERVHSAFKPDPNIPARFQSRNDDYWDSGWSRGHMAPAS